MSLADSEEEEEGETETCVGFASSKPIPDDHVDYFLHYLRLGQEMRFLVERQVLRNEKYVGYGDNKCVCAIPFKQIVEKTTLTKSVLSSVEISPQEGGRPLTPVTTAKQHFDIRDCVMCVCCDFTGAFALFVMDLNEADVAENARLMSLPEDERDGKFVSPLGPLRAVYPYLSGVVISQVADSDSPVILRGGVAEAEVVQRMLMKLKEASGDEWSRVDVEAERDLFPGFMKVSDSKQLFKGLNAARSKSPTGAGEFSPQWFTKQMSSMEFCNAYLPFSPETGYGHTPTPCPLIPDLVRSILHNPLSDEVRDNRRLSRFTKLLRNRSVQDEGLHTFVDLVREVPVPGGGAESESEFDISDPEALDRALSLVQLFIQCASRSSDLTCLPKIQSGFLARLSEMEASDEKKAKLEGASMAVESLYRTALAWRGWGNAGKRTFMMKPLLGDGDAMRGADSGSGSSSSSSSAAVAAEVGRMEKGVFLASIFVDHDRGLVLAEGGRHLPHARLPGCSYHRWNDLQRSHIDFDWLLRLNAGQGGLGPTIAETVTDAMVADSRLRKSFRTAAQQTMANFGRLGVLVDRLLCLENCSAAVFLTVCSVDSAEFELPEDEEFSWCQLYEFEHRLYHLYHGLGTSDRIEMLTELRGGVQQGRWFEDALRFERAVSVPLPAGCYLGYLRCSYGSSGLEVLVERTCPSMVPVEWISDNNGARPTAADLAESSALVIKEPNFAESEEMLSLVDASDLPFPKAFYAACVRMRERVGRIRPNLYDLEVIPLNEDGSVSVILIVEVVQKKKLSAPEDASMEFLSGSLFRLFHELTYLPRLVDLRAAAAAGFFPGAEVLNESGFAGDSARVRDYVLKCQVLPALFHLIERRPSLTCLRTAVWALSNLCRGKPLPDFNVVSRCIPLLAFLIHNSDVEVLTDACWALSYLTDGPNQRIQAVIEANFVKRIVELLTHHQVAVQTPALRTIGNIVTGNDEQTQIVVACNGLPALRKLLDHHKKTIKKEAVWSVSNLAAGAQSQLQAVLEQQGLFAKIVNFLTVPEFEIRREATWCVTNALTTGSLKQVHGLVLNGVVQPLCEILALEDAHIVLVALDGIDALLAKGKEMMRQQQTPRNPYCFFVEKAGGVEKIEDLQNHKNHDVYQKALSILEKYFEIAEATGGDGDDEDYSFMRDIQPAQYDF